MSDTQGEDCGINPVQIRGWPIEACRVHDRLYKEGSWAQQNITRKQADDHLLKMLLELSGKNIGKQILSYAMYGITRATGWLWWEGKK